MRVHKFSGQSATTSQPPPPPPSNAAEVVDFRGFFRVETYPHSAVIYRPGDTSDKLFLVKTGRVRLLRQGRGAHKAVLAILRPGDLFGEVLRSSAEPMEEMAVAYGEAEVWSIDGRDFRALIEARPALALDVIRALNDRVRSMRRRVLALTFKEVPARLAETLIVLGESFGEKCPHGGEIDLRGITQQDLADMVGASRSFVSTLVNDLKREGFVGNVGRTLCIKDQKALRKVAAKEK